MSASHPPKPRSGFWRSLRPDKLLFGPVFAKEVIVSGRRASTYWTRGLFALLVAALVSIFLWGHWNELRFDGVAQRLQGMQAVGPQMAWQIVWIQFVVVTLIAPALTAACISEESGNRTLSALMTTPLTSAQIVMGKMASRMTQLIILGLLTFPALMMLRLLGGLETEAVVAGAVLTLSAAFFAASIGLLLSVLNKRPWSVMVLSEVITLAYMIGPIAVLMIYVMLTAGMAGPGAGFERLIVMTGYVSPAVALGMVMGQSQGAGIPINTLHAWLSAAGVTFATGGVLCMLAIGLTRRTMRAEIRGSVRPERRGRKKRARRTGANRLSRTVSDDPVFWLEMRSRWVGSKWAAGTLALIILGFLGWVFYTAIVNQEWEALHYSLLIMLALAQAFMAMVSTTSRIASERQKRTWEVLLTTPLPAWRIVMGKLMAGLIRLSPIPILLALYFALVSSFGLVAWWTSVEIVWLVAAWSVFLGASGLFWSSVFRRPITASVVNMVSAAGLWMGAPLFVGVLFGALLDRYIEELLPFQGLMLINPAYLMVESLEGGIVDGYRHSGAYYPYDYSFMDQDLAAPEFFLLCLGSGLIAMVASVLLVVATSIRARVLTRTG